MVSVINELLSNLIIVITSAIIVLFFWKGEKEVRSQKIDDLPVLATCLSRT